jgi:Ca2+-binding RTX toxin-like protein
MREMTSYRAATGDDEVWGAEGNDVVYGGQGKDKVFGSSGNDTIYAEKDLDEVDAGAGKNRVDFVAYDPSLGSSITVNGSDEYRERVMADIEFLGLRRRGSRCCAPLMQAAAT